MSSEEWWPASASSCSYTDIFIGTESVSISSPIFVHLVLRNAIQGVISVGVIRDESLVQAIPWDCSFHSRPFPFQRKGILIHRFECQTLYKNGGLGRYISCAPLPSLRTTHFSLRTMIKAVCNSMSRIPLFTINKKGTTETSHVMSFFIGGRQQEMNWFRSEHHLKDRRDAQMIVSHGCSSTS